MTPATMVMMQARAKHKHITKREVSNLPVLIEYEDDDYTYISSWYPHHKIKADIEHIKRPITIHYSGSSPL